MCTDDACSDGACAAGAALDCDDGNQCTINVCDPAVGCYTLPNNNPCCVGQATICDDGNACTTDVCNPDDATCSYEDSTDPCDDGDPCTEGDACAAGSCQGTTATCDDASTCFCHCASYPQLRCPCRPPFGASADAPTSRSPRA